MKKIVILIIVLILVIFTMISCTDNQRAKNWGGTETVTLPENCIFINSTWKENQLWIVVCDTVKNQYYMYEKSAFGLLEGKIIFK